MTLHVIDINIMVLKEIRCDGVIVGHKFAVLGEERFPPSVILQHRRPDVLNHMWHPRKNARSRAHLSNGTFRRSRKQCTYQFVETAAKRSRFLE